jgi:hypothetical protein
MAPGSQAWRGRGITPVALRAPSSAPEATSFRGGPPLEASSEAEAVAEVGMPTPLTAETATTATTEAAALRTAAEATEAVRREGPGAAPEAAPGLAGRPPNLFFSAAELISTSTSTSKSHIIFSFLYAFNSL